MPWSRVVDILNRAVAKMLVPSDGGGWVTSLTNSEDGDLLGICLAIDLEAESLTLVQLASILDTIVATGDARKDFYSAVQRQQPTVRCASRHASDPLPAESVYIRIMELGDFITYYLEPVHGFTTEPGDVEMVRRLFLKSGGRTLHDLDQMWSGKHGIVWVVARDEILGDQPPSILGDVAAAEIADRLGLGMKGGVGPGNRLELVMVVYPPAFEDVFAVRCRQPTSLDANWEVPGTLYVSEGRGNAWGRTRSCSGALSGVKERVHPALARPDHSFILYPVGVTVPPKIDRSTIVRDAYRRLK